MWGTTDGGKTWEHLGLENTQSIRRVVVDPTNPKIAFVAAGGHLFGPNPDRGLYKTTDGGKNWKKAKYIDADTGFTDVAIDPSNPKIVLCVFLQRRRTWWGYNGGGPNSALWKSTDGGDNWTKIDGPGWPKPKDGIYGRIAISISARSRTSFTRRWKPARAPEPAAARRPKAVRLAAAADRPPAAVKARRTTRPRPVRRLWLAAGRARRRRRTGRRWWRRARQRLHHGSRHGWRSAAAVAVDAAQPRLSPNPNGSGVFRSEDGGKTWKRCMSCDDRPTYFSQIRVDPVNDQKIFVGGNPARMSLDGGKTWTGLTGSHTDYHAIWINPKDPRIVWVGHDGGFDISNDGGLTWDLSQRYRGRASSIRCRPTCAGLITSAAACRITTPGAARARCAPTPGRLNTDWFTVAGGDGFYTRQDPTDWAIVYGESQDGDMSRHDLRNGTQKSIRPRAGGGRGAAAGTTAVG